MEPGSLWAQEETQLLEAEEFGFLLDVPGRAGLLFRTPVLWKD